MAKYWEQETPVTVDTGKNILQYYGQAGKLSVARPMWKDDEGKERNGKTVALDIAALLECDKTTMKQAHNIFSCIVKDLDERLSI